MPAPPPQYHFNPNDNFSHYREDGNMGGWFWRQQAHNDQNALMGKKEAISHVPQDPSALKDYRQTSCHRAFQNYEKCVESNSGNLEPCKNSWDKFDSCRDLSI